MKKGLLPIRFQVFIELFLGVIPLIDSPAQNRSVCILFYYANRGLNEAVKSRSEEPSTVRWHGPH